MLVVELVELVVVDSVSLIKRTAKPFVTVKNPRTTVPSTYLN